MSDQDRDETPAVPPAQVLAELAIEVAAGRFMAAIADGDLTKAARVLLAAGRTWEDGIFAVAARTAAIAVDLAKATEPDRWRELLTFAVNDVEMRLHLAQVEAGHGES